MTNTYPLTKIKVYSNVGSPRNMKNILCFINPDSSCYAALREKGGNIEIYIATFKVESGENAYVWYTDQVVIWNSPYLTPNKVKEAIINTGIERDGFIMYDYFESYDESYF